MSKALASETRLLILEAIADSPDMPLWVKPGSLATINALDQLRKGLNLNGPI